MRLKQRAKRNEVGSEVSGNKVGSEDLPMVGDRTPSCSKEQHADRSSAKLPIVAKLSEEEGREEGSQEAAGAGGGSYQYPGHIPPLV